MASRKPLNYPRFQLLDSNGRPIPNGTVEFFDAGTTNNRDVYSDASLSTTLPNPVTLNSRGEPETGGGTATDIYLDSNPYKIVTKDANSATIWTIDNYIADLVGPSDPQDPANATDSGTDTFQASLNADPSSGETLQIDFQSANTTTTPTFENTSGSLGALTIKTRDGSALWSGALNGAHELYYDGTDLLVIDPYYGSQDLDTDATVVFGGYDPEHATDSGTDAYVSATNTTVPAAGVQIVRDFQSANTTTTPTLDGKTITTRDGSALWANALSGPHTLQLASDSGSWLVLYPNPSEQRDFTRAASATQRGDVELATNAETQTGTDTERAVTPAGAASTYARIATGTYTGDGTTSQSITGVGFQPVFLKIWDRQTTDSGDINLFETSDTIIDDNASGGSVLHVAAGAHDFRTDRIISLDADGFTVDDAGVDGNPNKDGQVYNYMAIG